jgi:sugar phosphate isomerase/epimerase
MKLAFSTNAYTRFSLPDALKGIAAAGFGAVEILADVPHAYPSGFSRVTSSFVENDLRRLNLAVSNINVNCSFGYWRDAPPEAYFEPSIISPNATHRLDRLALIRNAMYYAKAVGATNISITSGRMLGGMPPAKAAAQFEQSMALLLGFADEIGINIGIECEPGLFLEYAEELKHWIDRLGHPRFGANLDVGHSQVMGESIPHAIELLGDRIWNLHIEDIPGRKHYHLIPGEGTMDWASLKSALRSIGYSRYLTVELYTQTDDPQSAAEKSYNFLRNHFE